MTRITANIRFKAKLLRPESPKGAAWAFLYTAPIAALVWLAHLALAAQR